MLYCCRSVWKRRGFNNVRVQRVLFQAIGVSCRVCFHVVLLAVSETYFSKQNHDKALIGIKVRDESEACTYTS